MIQVSVREAQKWYKRGFKALGIVTYMDKQEIIMIHHSEPITENKKNRGAIDGWSIK